MKKIFSLKKKSYIASNSSQLGVVEITGIHSSMSLLQNVIFQLSLSNISPDLST